MLGYPHVLSYLDTFSPFALLLEISGMHSANPACWRPDNSLWGFKMLTTTLLAC